MGHYGSGSPRDDSTISGGILNDFVPGISHGSVHEPDAKTAT